MNTYLIIHRDAHGNDATDTVQADSVDVGEGGLQFTAAGAVIATYEQWSSVIQQEQP